MGTWKLEVARMAVYMVFPVGAFYVFNQPQWFEEATIEERRRIFKPTSKEHTEVSSYDDIDNGHK